MIHLQCRHDVTQAEGDQQLGALLGGGGGGAAAVPLHLLQEPVLVQADAGHLQRRQVVEGHCQPVEERLHLGPKLPASSEHGFSSF